MVDVAVAVAVVKAQVAANATTTVNKPPLRTAQKRVNPVAKAEMRAAMRVVMNAVRIATVALKKVLAKRPTPTTQHLSLIAQPQSPTRA